VNPSADAYALGFSADSSRFFTGTIDGDIETWDVKTANQINSINIGDSVSSAATSPTDIAVAITDRIILLDTNAEQKTGELASPGENQFVAFNSDGSMLASASSSGQIQIWQKTNGKFEPLKTLKKQQPYSIAFNSQGNLLAVTTVNNVYIVDTTSGEEVSRIPHKGIVYNVSFSPDGTTLATASLKTIQLWDVSTLQKLDTAGLIETACSHLIWNFSNPEWHAMFGDQPYKKLCENLPVP